MARCRGQEEHPEPGHGQSKGWDLLGMSHPSCPAALRSAPGWDLSGLQVFKDQVGHKNKRGPGRSVGAGIQRQGGQGLDLPHLNNVQREGSPMPTPLGCSRSHQSRAEAGDHIREGKLDRWDTNILDWCSHFLASVLSYHYSNLLFQRH